MRGSMEESQPPRMSERLRELELKHLGGALALVVLLIFIFQNTDDTQVEFLWLDIAMPLFLLLLLTSVLACLVVILVQRASRKRRSS